ncbi:MAG: hypothetical protein KH547_02055 [Roseburia sp.]|jgi:hypothetical protein|nr:hypothetical protein [Roseburia sp.]
MGNKNSNMHFSISLDPFRSVVQNIDTEQKAWLSFLTADDPDEIVQLVNAYPEFLPCYRDIISFRRRPKELITTFSDALREMDRNTKVYMVEQLAKEVQEKDHALAEKDNTFDISILLNYICHFSRNAHRTTFLFPS